MSRLFRSMLWGLGLLAVLVAGTCARTPSDDTMWAEPAERSFVKMAEAFCEADFASAEYFVANGSIDFRMFGGTIATTAEDMAVALELYLTGPQGSRGEIVLEDLYLSADGAFGSYGLSEDNRRILNWAALYAIEGDRIDGRVLSWYFVDTASLHHPLLLDGAELYDRYIDAWSRPDRRAVATVYTRDAVVVDSLTGRTWSGQDEIIAGIKRYGPAGLEPGPWPTLFAFDIDGARDLVAIIQTTGGCPMREARRWILRGDRIMEEIRFWHVPSVRRCGLDLDDGWWSDFEPRDGSSGVSNRKTLIGGGVVEIVNAEWEQLEFVRWVFDRYRLGLGRPDVSAVWFPPSVDCGSDGSFARRQDERFEGGHSVTFCLYDDELLSRDPVTRWTTDAARLGLHEFAHVWMYEHLTDADRAEFVRLTQADDWRAADWGSSGIELAAETIAWGVSGDGFDVYDIEPRPSCAELTARYEFLTGRAPLTTCTGSGGV